MSGYLAAARAALTTVRKTGKYLGTKVDSSEFKDAARMVYNRGGSSEMGKFLSNPVGGAAAGAQSVLADAKYGFDEVDWPKGAAKLPKGALDTITRTVLSHAEKAGSDFVKGVSRIIPSETASGQTGLFPAGSYKSPKPKASNMKGAAVSMKPPFKPSGTGRPAPGASRMAARNAELVMKRKTKAASAAVTQQNAMDVAKSAGQITDREIMKTNKIINRRRRAAM
jgi:hypothetical protein